MEGLEFRRGRDLGDFTNFFLKLVNFGCVEGEEGLGLNPDD